MPLGSGPGGRVLHDFCKGVAAWGALALYMPGGLKLQTSLLRLVYIGFQSGLSVGSVAEISKPDWLYVQNPNSKSLKYPSRFGPIISRPFATQDNFGDVPHHESWLGVGAGTTQHEPCFQASEVPGAPACCNSISDLCGCRDLSWCQYIYIYITYNYM